MEKKGGRGRGGKGRQRRGRRKEVGGEGRRGKRKGEERRGRRGRWEGERRRSCPVIVFDAWFRGQKASRFQLPPNYISCPRTALAKMSVFCASQTPGSCPSDLCHPVCQRKSRQIPYASCQLQTLGAHLIRIPGNPSVGGSVKELPYSCGGHKRRSWKRVLSTGPL